MNLQKYTQKSIEAVQTAKTLAESHAHQQIEQVHLLCALLEADGGLVGELVEQLSGSRAAMLTLAQQEIEKIPSVHGGDGNVYDTLASVFTGVSAYSFLVFNLLCAPCFAAIGAIKREMNSAKWTWFAIGYQCGFAYVIALMINQFGGLFTGNVNVIGLIFAALCLAGIIYMLVRPYKEATKLTAKVKA